MISESKGEHDYLRFWESGVYWEIWWCAKCGTVKWEQRLPHQDMETRFYAVGSREQAGEEPLCSNAPHVGTIKNWEFSRDFNGVPSVVSEELDVNYERVRLVPSETDRPVCPACLVPYPPLDDYTKFGTKFTCGVCAYEYRFVPGEGSSHMEKFDLVDKEDRETLQILEAGQKALELGPDSLQHIRDTMPGAREIHERGGDKALVEFLFVSYTRMFREVERLYMVSPIHAPIIPFKEGSK